jgi:hypothetical protein
MAVALNHCHRALLSRTPWQMHRFETECHSWQVRVYGMSQEHHAPATTTLHAVHPQPRAALLPPTQLCIMYWSGSLLEPTSLASCRQPLPALACHSSCNAHCHPTVRSKRNDTRTAVNSHPHVHLPTQHTATCCCAAAKK